MKNYNSRYILFILMAGLLGCGGAGAGGGELGCCVGEHTAEREDQGSSGKDRRPDEQARYPGGRVHDKVQRRFPQDNRESEV